MKIRKMLYFYAWVFKWQYHIIERMQVYNRVILIITKRYDVAMPAWIRYYRDQDTPPQAMDRADCTVPYVNDGNDNGDNEYRGIEYKVEQRGYDEFEYAAI